MFSKLINRFKKTDVTTNENKWVFGTMLVFALIALTAAFVLSVEEIHIIKNPDAVLSCTFNLILDCSKVMQTWQASVFGFPNMFIGLMAYPVIVTIAILGLAGTQFPRLFLKLANIGFLLGTIFAYWLFFNSVYVIQILCPWCLVVTFSTTLILATMTHYNLRQNTFGFKKKANGKIQVFLNKDYHKVIVASWIVIMVALVIIKFGAALFA
jgi:uncharacterized membrane protein